MTNPLGQYIAPLVLTALFSTGALGQGVVPPPAAPVTYDTCTPDPAVYDSLPINENGVVMLEGADFFAAVAGLRQFTVVGTNHRVEELEYMAQKGVMEALQRAGIKKLYMELPDDYQSVVQQYYTAPVDDNASYHQHVLDSLEQYFQPVFAQTVFGQASGRAARAFVNTLQYARENSITIHLYDTPSQVARKQPEMAEIYKNSLHAADTGNADTEQYRVFLNALYADRNAQDARMAAEIRADAGAGHAVIDIGIQHVIHCGPENPDLDEFLGEGQTITVQFIKSINDPAYRWFYDESGKRDPGKDMPAFFFDVRTGRAFRPPLSYNPDNAYYPTPGPDAPEF